MGKRTTDPTLLLRLALLVPFVCHSVSTEAAEAPADWQCAGCIVWQAWNVDLSLAPAYVADDAYRFGDYTGLDEKGAYLFGDLLGDYRDDNANYFRFDGFTLSPSSTVLNLEGGKQGAYRLRASYRAIPRRFYDSTATPFTGNGSDALTLPADWVRAPNTSSMTSLPGALAPVTVRRDWDVLNLGVDILPDSRWTISADFTHTERQGRDVAGGAFLFNSTELARPIDYTTDEFKLGVRYGADRWQAAVEYRGSFFENGNESLQWDNPFTGQPGADVGAIALAPDNESHQLSFSGAVRLPARTVLSGQIATGRLSQDEELLPYTINPTIETLPLPVSSAGADADTLNVNLRITSTPTRRVTLEGSLRVNDFENKRPVSVFDYVITDSVPAGQAVRNLAYDYERTDAKFMATVRAARQTRVLLGAENRRFERTFQERERTRADHFWVRLRQGVGRSADVRAELFTERRRGSEYQTLEDTTADQNPLMRKYNMANRDRRGIRLRGSVFPGERWDLGWDFESGEDDYEDTAIGLTRSRYTRAGADVSWILGRGSLFAGAWTERTEVNQANSQTFSLPDWMATTRDRFDSANIGWQQPRLFGPVGLRLEYTWSRSRGEIDNDTSGLRSSFPDLTSRRDTLRLGFDYPINDRWDLAFDYLYEQLESSDWALDGVGPATVPNLLAFGRDPFNYDVNVVFFSVRYLQGQRGR